MKKIVIGKVSCPNHGCPLELDNMQLTQLKGSSPCPVSKELFDWEQLPEADSYVKDKDGNIKPAKSFVVSGDD